MCICDFTRPMYNLQLWYRMSHRLWGELGRCNRSPQRTKWTFWSVPPRTCLPGFHPFPARSLQLQRCDLSTMVGLTGVKQASVLLMAAGTNDQNSWKRSRAAKTHFCWRAGARPGTEPKACPVAVPRTTAGFSHMIRERPFQLCLISAGMAWTHKDESGPRSLKVQRCIRHARPSVSCSMANSRLANWSHPTTVQYWFKSVQTNNRGHVIKVPAPHCVEVRAF